VSRPNINSPTFDEPREHPGFRCLRARLGRQAGTEKIGLSLWELPPGEAAYPYHWHVAEEELIIVLDGRPSVLTQSGWTEMGTGDVVSFKVGEGGAHQIVNRTDESIRFLAFSNQQTDIVVYPDSAKLGVFERRPEGGGVHEMFRLADAVDYYDGEEPPQGE
jgi:uncharacterized cupin superfamily protein